MEQLAPKIQKTTAIIASIAEMAYADARKLSALALLIVKQLPSAYHC